MGIWQLDRFSAISCRNATFWFPAHQTASEKGSALKKRAEFASFGSYLSLKCIEYA